MKKFALVVLTVAAVVCFSASAFAGNVAPGESAKCTDAKAITLTAQGNSSAGDRTNANAVIWKSSNFTTVPITLGAGGHHGLEGDRHVGMADKHSMGRSTVTLTSQENFSRGDSIGDISGEVRITNTGTIAIDVNCG